MNKEALKEKMTVLWIRTRRGLKNAWLWTYARLPERLKGKLSTEEMTSLMDKVQAIIPKDSESLSNLFDQAVEKIRRQKLARYGKLLTVMMCAYFLADLVVLLVQDKIPEPTAPVPVRRSNFDGSSSASNDDIIFGRNLFNSKGYIPGEEGNQKDGPAVKTTLPFNLIGTLIFHDELKSLATIEDKGVSDVFAVRVADEIPSKARITKVDTKRVTFVNLQNGRNEYIDLPEDLMTSNPIITIKPSTGGSSSKGKAAQIEQVAPNHYIVPRKEIDAALGDINSILTQARAVPNWENGVFTGYKIFQIVPGSIYDKLGLKNGDLIKKVDGDLITDPAKAFEKLSSLKERNTMDMTINRNGQDLPTTFDIN